MNDNSAKMYPKIACNISSGRYGICLQERQSSLIKKSAYILNLNVHLNM